MSDFDDDLRAWAGQLNPVHQLAMVERVTSDCDVAVAVASRIGHGPVGRAVLLLTRSGAIDLAVMLLHNAGIDARGVVLESDVKKAALKRARSNGQQRLRGVG